MCFVKDLCKFLCFPISTGNHGSISKQTVPLSLLFWVTRSFLIFCLLCYLQQSWEGGEEKGIWS